MFSKIKEYDQKFKDKVLHIEREVGAADASRLCRVSCFDIYLMYCENLQIDPLTHKNLRTNAYPKRFKDKVISYALKTTKCAAVQKYKVSKTSLYQWMKDAGIICNSARNQYPQGLKNEVLSYVLQNDISTAVKKYNISYSTIRRWVKKEDIPTKKKLKYTEDIKDAVVVRALQASIDAAMRDYNVSKSSVIKWLKEAGMYTFSKTKYSQKFKDEVILFACKNGYQKTALKYGVSRPTIKKWCSEAGKPSPFKKTVLLSAEKKKIARESRKTTKTFLAQKYNISLQTVYNICKKYKKHKKEP